MRPEKLLEGLRVKLSDDNYQKILRIVHPKVIPYIFEANQLCEPESIFICDDSQNDLAYIREMAIKSGEEKPLATPGHTYHFDGMYDLARDRKSTKFLVPEGEFLPSNLNQIERNKGLKEVKDLLRGAMKGKTMIVRFLVLGPLNSPFTLLCMECTDSWYVAHSVSLLYRSGYGAFTQAKEEEIFYTLHSAGRLNKEMVSIDYSRKCIYIDYKENVVYSVNTQYAGNSVGFKKLALRLAIRKAHSEGWLAEHFMIIGVHHQKGKTYLAGAFPSGCGKTSTAMLPGETILADDLAYVRNIEGVCQAVNVEAGIFGIIQNVNPKDDSLIYKTLTSPGEIIFTNCLIKDGKPYWLGMGSELPKEGVNYSGRWWEGKTDNQGNLILPSHRNARYTVALRALENCDPELDNPQGVELGGIIFGGRDYRGYVPVQEGFDWRHGVIAYGAGLETETTFTIVEEEGKYEINIMSIQDFISIPLGKYLKNYIEFAKNLKKVPLVFGVNYFLKDLKGETFLNSRVDKHIWIKWMAKRINNEVGAIKTPTGLIPKYEDLRILFKEVLNKDYSFQDYSNQFILRVPENLAKIRRVRKFYQEKVEDTPEEVFFVLKEQEERLLLAQKRFGDYISPHLFEKECF
ncbi:MAG: phosphoenolpyruvate carboxykinase (GTP) [Candidatus Omnitrophica bacterium 4484_70.1]|nr:MAG: phosphoenolpyruvate carboxykinase (GTP) [Candidatus Omnitrophica bacterium 4484_70.1]